MDKYFSTGDIVCIEMRSGIYQILSQFNEEQFLVRKIFSTKMELKISKAILVHKSWLSHCVKKKKEIDELIASDRSIAEILASLTIEPMYSYGTNGTESLKTIFYSANKSDIKDIQKEINSSIHEFLLVADIQAEIDRLVDEKKLNVALAGKKEDHRIYRIEFGRYETDFDDSGNKIYRDVRLYEMKNF